MNFAKNWSLFSDYLKSQQAADAVRAAGEPPAAEGAATATPVPERPADNRPPRTPVRAAPPLTDRSPRS